MAAKQRISYVPLDDMTPEMRAEMERCAREGTPRPESSAIRAHVPAAFWFFANSWHDLFRNGVGRPRRSRSCAASTSRGRSSASTAATSARRRGARRPVEGQYDELLNFETTDAFDERQKAALAYAEAIAWHLDTDDAFWDRMHAQFTEPELVELGCMIGLTLGQQSWLRMLNIEHHEVMPGTTASMAPASRTPRRSPPARPPTTTGCAAEPRAARPTIRDVAERRRGGSTRRPRRAR